MTRPINLWKNSLKFILFYLSGCLSPADSQRKGLEKRFQIQKYISKPDRKKLAERLGLKDSQVSRCRRVMSW